MPASTYPLVVPANFRMLNSTLCQRIRLPFHPPCLPPHPAFLPNKEKEELVGELSAAMQKNGYDATPISEAMGGR